MADRSAGGLEFDEPVAGQRLRISGRVRILDIPDMRVPFLTAVDAGVGDLEVDVAGVVVTDLAVVGLLLELHRRAERRGRRLVIDNVPNDLDRLLRRTRVNRVLQRKEFDAVPAPDPHGHGLASTG